MNILSFCHYLAVVLLMLIRETKAWNAEAKLRDKLFSNNTYKTLTIPVQNSSDILDIYLALYITQIIDVDERNQILTTKVWLHQSWNDYRLSWDPDEYDGITEIKVPINYVWLPDILIYNNADGPYDIEAQTWAGINYNGTVVWFPPAVYKSACQIDVQWYPFDEQTCILKFGSWTHAGDTLDLKPAFEHAQRKHYWPNGEWTIESSPCSRTAKKYPCCEELYIDLTFAVTLRRKPLFYFAYLLLPCGLISFNTILVFYLPPDISEKMSLCTNVLLSLAVFLLLITVQIPANANSFPLIVKYLLFTMVVVASSIVLTVFVLNIRFRSPETHKMSKFTRTVFLDYLPRMLGMSRPEKYTKRYRNVGIMFTRDAIERNKLNTSKLAMENRGNNYTLRMRRETELHKDDWSHKLDAAGSSDVDPRMYMPLMDGDVDMSEGMLIHRTIEELLFLTWHVKNEEDAARDREDYKFLAMVIDRIFLLLYLISVIVGIIWIIFQAPLSPLFFNELFAGFEEEEYDKGIEIE
ncbi:Neuronal acetylcholine receptor subunit alpha-3 [Holothuria leucospilota]|uniref:Neuronal acetylcholine receptor subunit alpha-3 n=1 Tax=Holothuria leucospilota TaxID=206669 RepID=A0A9Q1HFF7_HOLLE|nr:Neuronal acetylcholine receptor subunit alpha-3 [Holothuria leucospilota]